MAPSRAAKSPDRPRPARALRAEGAWRNDSPASPSVGGTTRLLYAPILRIPDLGFIRKSGLRSGLWFRSLMKRKDLRGGATMALGVQKERQVLRFGRVCLPFGESPAL